MGTETVGKEMCDHAARTTVAAFERLRPETPKKATEAARPLHWWNNWTVLLGVERERKGEIKFITYRHLVLGHQE